MLNETDNVGQTFKRAFFRVDGVTMYFFWAVWLGLTIWTFFDPAPLRMAAWALFLLGLMLNPFIYVLLGVMRSPGLLTALIIIFFNVKFLLIFV
ncbi:hypothetical protein [Pseudomonas sp. MWU16-30322]|uniref:hypothetical protein n=1 Tax=Pseudomonas sp. MWU16-30322 TaxID=2878092 RepID=UPI001CFA1DF0|nr:hypothetical protein [Pseudomonas sp. MWU16-30322]